MVNTRVKGGAVRFGELQVPGDFKIAPNGTFDDAGLEELRVEGDAEVVVIKVRGGRQVDLL